MSYRDEQLLKRGGLSAKPDWRLEFVEACAEVDSLRARLAVADAALAAAREEKADLQWATDDPEDVIYDAGEYCADCLWDAGDHTLEVTQAKMLPNCWYGWREGGGSGMNRLFGPFKTEQEAKDAMRAALHPATKEGKA